MSSFWNFAFGALLVIIWIISGGFVTQANVFLSPYKNTDADIHRAYWFTFWAAFVTWFLVGIFIILVILSVIGVVALFGSGAGEAGVAAEGADGVTVAKGAELSRSARARNYAKSPEGQENIKTGVSLATIAFLVLALILVGITGILSALAASSMVKSTNYNPSIEKLKRAYNNCIIAASMCLGAGGLLIIGIITYFIIGLQRQKKLDAEKEYAEKRRQVELAEIQQLKQRAVLKKVEQQAEFKQELQQAERQALLNRVSQEAAEASNTPIATPQVTGKLSTHQLNTLLNSKMSQINRQNLNASLNQLTQHAHLVSSLNKTYQEQGLGSALSQANS